MGDTTRRLQEFSLKNGQLILTYHPSGGVTIRWYTRHTKFPGTVDLYADGDSLKKALANAEKADHDQELRYKESLR